MRKEKDKYLKELEDTLIKKLKLKYLSLNENHKGNVDITFIKDKENIYDIFDVFPSLKEIESAIKLSFKI